MSYQIEQKNGDKVYVYEATYHWDSEKKRSQQTCVYLGVKDPKTGEVLTPRKDKWKKCESNVRGVMYAVEECSTANHLRETLDHAFGTEDRGKISGTLLETLPAMEKSMGKEFVQRSRERVRFRMKVPKGLWDWLPKIVTKDIKEECQERAETFADLRRTIASERQAEVNFSGRCPESLITTVKYLCASLFCLVSSSLF